MAHVDDQELLRLVGDLSVAYSELDNDRTRIANYRKEAEKFTKLADQEQAKVDQAVAKIRTEATKLRDAMTEPTVKQPIPEFPGTEQPTSDGSGKGGGV